MVLAFLTRLARSLFAFGTGQDRDLPVYELEDVRPNAVPLYDTNGGIYAYLAPDSEIPRSRRAIQDDRPSLVQRSARPSIRRTPYAPAPSQPAPPTRSRAVQGRQPNAAAPQRVPLLRQSSPSTVDGDATEWDGWPDGDFSRLFSLEEAEACDNLRVHWACEPLSGGSGGGSAQAETWPEGKVTRRKCQGVIFCTTPGCDILVRPQTRAAGIRKQLAESCSCGGSLAHERCGVVSVLHTFKHGVHYENGGFHAHLRPSVRLHMSRKEKETFKKVVEADPKTGPLRMLVGRSSVHGPGQSVADISPVLYNSQRIKYERRKILKGSGGNGGGDNFVHDFAKFQEKHPDFIREAQFGKVSVIVMQTPFMASKLVKSTIDLEAVNGIVSDAAHRVWRAPNSLLIVSSTFEPERLKCWVPGIMSYSNGGTAEHYRIHFFHLFVSMARECGSRNIPITDALMANVVDFSGAQRKGFILAFIDFWLEHAPGERSIDELMEAAEKSLKGCAQHFRNQITRVKKISGVVDPSKADIFENHARRLLTSKSMDEFTDRANKFIKDFPRAEPWIRWWMLPAHAIMLFPAFRVMNPELWDSIPETTNAEEAMHWKLYAAIGRFLSLLDGMKRLYKFAEHYQRLFDAAGRELYTNPFELQLKDRNLDGVKIFYGRDRQSWKRAAEKFGTTKYSRRRAAIRAAKHANDGRPPDTGKALLGRGARKQKHEYEKSYAWKENSCWLDSSLTLLSAAAARDDASIDAMFADLPAGHPLRDLRQMLHTRLNSVNLTEYEDGGCRLLNQQRDGFRRALCEVPHSPIETTTGFDTMFGWLYHISGKRVPHTRESRPSVERAQSYFAMSRILFKVCVGSSNEHYQVSPVQLRNIIQLHSDLCRRYDGDLRKWFQEYVRVSKPEPLDRCWHARDGVALCDGSANAFEVVLNIPIVLIIELGDIRSSVWNIPSSLSPYANNPSASSSGVKYTIVGHIYCSQAAQHFIARYLTPSGKKIFDYNGMKHEGHAIRSKVTAVRGSLTGPSRSMAGVPSGYFLYAVMYHLVGGEPAQRFFRKQQINDAAKLGLQLDIDPSSKTGIPSAVQLVRPRVQRIADDDRFWLLAPLADKNIDYILPEPEPSPRKKRASLSPQKKRQLPAVIHSIESDSEDIDNLLLETLEPPVNKSPKKSSRAQKPAKPRTPKGADTSLPYTDSTTPCPVFCEGCGMQESDGDDDPDEVQCEKCRLWAHIACLASNVDWADPKVKFICKRCSEDPLVDLWHPQQVVLIPSPLVPSWKAPGVLWYPARFIERHKKRAGKKDEYEFRWLECNDGTIYNSATSDLPVMIQRTFHRTRKFCQEIYEVHLNENQVGVIRLPRYMDPTFERHENPALAAIFDAAEPRIAKILARFSSNHPVVANFEAYFNGKKTISRSRDAEKWLRTCELISNPELDAVLEPVLSRLMNHPDLKHIPLPERSERVPGVGSALLQLLAVQHALGEPLNLNGDLLGDLLDDRVVHRPNDGEEGLEAMFAVTGDASQVAGRMLRFRAQHAMYDEEYRPPTYHRLEKSRRPATDAIRVIFKRKADEEVEEQPPAKRAKGRKADVRAETAVEYYSVVQFEALY
ncbi:hypothetical protein DFH06DRAFT_1407814 [Mycena polygramma]|nr:hypothetical protein DFH06DRAFT_1407814 [Mycena polygramma]